MGVVLLVDVEVVLKLEKAHVLKKGFDTHQDRRERVNEERKNERTLQLAMRSW